MRPRRVVAVLMLATLLVVAVGVFGQLAPVLWPGFDQPGFSAGTNLGGEHNIPATYNALLLFLASSLLWLIGRLARQRREAQARVWTGLAGLAFFFMLDEYFVLHERLIDLIRPALGLGGYLYYAWVIPYGLLVLAVLALLARFLRRLPARTRWGLLSAGVLYVSGALGVELLEGQLESSRLSGTFAPGETSSFHISMTLLIGLEESLEMVALVVLIATLLRHLGRFMPGAALRLELERGGPP